jgi:hypothetical protein
MRPHIASLTQSIRKSFTDTFQRSNTSGDPGITADGSRWNVLNGTFNIATNTLTTATAASSYPLSVVEMGVQNVNIGLVASGQGATAALWVTDAGNWWGVQTFSQPENCNCYDYSYSYNCHDVLTGSGTTWSTCYQTVCIDVGHTGYTPASYTPGYCAVQVGYYCASYVSGSYTPASYYTYWTTECGPSPYDCNPQYWATYNYVCSTGYATACSTCYPQYFKIIKNISGTITSVWSQAVAAVSAAFRVKTSGDVITIQAYSDSGLSTQIGSDLTYTATGSTKSTKFGLAIAPSSYNQTSTINKITINRN